MERLAKIGKLEPKRSLDVKDESPMGLGMEKLDRDAFDPAMVYDKVASLGVKWIRPQSGWQKTEREEGVYDFAWLDSQVDALLLMLVHHTGIIRTFQTRGSYFSLQGI